MTILAVLVIGAVAGWLAGLIVRGAGFGLIGNIVIGIIGALVASWLLPKLGVSLGGSAVRDIVNATIGAAGARDISTPPLVRLSFSSFSRLSGAPDLSLSNSRRPSLSDRRCSDRG